ncbi:MAG TPA: class I SAM-dependent methyltransferase [Gemmataceae bacterium]|nr:class I SAM-dependent methyltransferase [Gemmataceae bacterium]
MTKTLTDRSIASFGEQWQKYQDNDGYYGSLEMFRDIFHPLLEPDEIAGHHVAEIGSGAGRIVNMLLAAGAAHVLAVEPSEAFTVLQANTRRYGQRVECMRCPGDQLPALGTLDDVFSVGVLHHIPDPAPVVRAAYRALRPGGRLAIWLYGKEGNRLYLSLVQPLRLLTQRLPHGLLHALSWVLDVPLAAYIGLCRWLPLPLRGYMREVMARLDGSKRRLTIYDQLNPAYSKYYTRQEALDLVRSAGFVDVAIHHRHGYSWTVVGRKPT